MKRLSFLKKRIKKAIRLDRVSFIVATIALGFSYWQGSAQIKHNHVSVEPRVHAYFSNNEKADEWGLYIINNGLGIAFINGIDVFVDNKPVPEHTLGLFYSAILKLGLNPMCFVVGGPRPNDSFQVGAKILYHAQNQPPTAAISRFLLF